MRIYNNWQQSAFIITSNFFFSWCCCCSYILLFILTYIKNSFGQTNICIWFICGYMHYIYVCIVYIQYVYVYYMFMYPYSYLLVYVCAFMKCIQQYTISSKHQDYYYYCFYVFVLLKAYLSIFVLFIYLFIYFIGYYSQNGTCADSSIRVFFHACCNLKKNKLCKQKWKIRNICFQQQYQ